ncbi:MAG: tRNA uridine(34) 5-carboxymethylaminomethyl modification radical SAM/GNAT enzyme Elp3 [Candidatus Bathyarchaeia archaeon]
MSSNPDAANEVFRRLVGEALNSEGVNRLKILLCKQLHSSRLPKNSELLTLARLEGRKGLYQTLQLKKVRSISGVNIVSVMSKPIECPHGRCAYCPHFEGVPPSYTGKEPATMRGLQNLFDPYLQVKSRLEQLKAIGHSTSKVDLIIQGGTFPASPIEYQRRFIKGCLDALTGQISESLEEAMENAVWSTNRNVGLTVETRPDYATEKEIDNMLSMGVTRVEVGVQNLYDDIYRLVDRGHSLEDVIRSFRLLKDSGLKIVAHMMPGLPGSDQKRDFDAFIRLFADPDLKPDMLKIYPCLVLRGTKIYDWWVRGWFKPYGLEETVNLLSQVKRHIPPWVRIMRIQRDIPAHLIVAGVMKGNLRQIVQERMRLEGYNCKCIRCREVGHRMMRGEDVPDHRDIKILARRYDSSGGVEIFISAESPDSECLVGYCRLRIPSEKAHRREIAGRKVGLIRELHVFGPLVPIGESNPEMWQHRGFGATLLKTAEKIASDEYDCKKILVTSALGSRRYFMRHGYSLDGPYMAREIK